MEVTKWLKPSISVSRYTVTARAAGRNASERRQSSKDNAQADPTGYRERLIRLGRMSKTTRPAAAPG